MSGESRKGATARGPRGKRVLYGLVPVTVIVAALAVALVGTAAANHRPECGGERGTIVGDRGDNVLIGTERSDVIIGRAGADYIIGKGDQDLLCGGRGDDTLKGRDNRDGIRGDRGDDAVYGNDRADILEGNLGDDAVHGGAGNDFCSGGKGFDRLSSCEDSGGGSPKTSISSVLDD